MQGNEHWLLKAELIALQLNINNVWCLCAVVWLSVLFSCVTYVDYILWCMTKFRDIRWTKKTNKTKRTVRQLRVAARLSQILDVWKSLKVTGRSEKWTHSSFRASVGYLRCSMLDLNFCLSGIVFPFNNEKLKANK